MSRPSYLSHNRSLTSHVQRLAEPTRPTTEEDWVRFDHYAQRVTGITYDRAALLGVTSALYRWLLSARPGKELFPNLYSFDWESKVGKDEREVYLSLGDYPSTFFVDASEGPCPPNAIPSVLAYLCHASSRIKYLLEMNLCCATAADMNTFQPSLTDALASLRKLRSLELEVNQAITFEALEALASLPCLEKLHIENMSPDSDFVSNAPCAADNEPPPPHHVFRALQVFELKLYRLCDATVVLSSFAFPCLEDLRAESEADSQSRHFYRIMRLATLRCSHDRLNTIYVGSGEYGGCPVKDAGAITTASLGHLCAFPNLRHVVVFSEMCIIATDEFIERFARTCPHLVSLSFFSSCAPGDRDWQDPQATLRSLVHLVQHCPQLVSVAMGLDTSDVDTLALPSESCYNTKFQGIDVGKAPLRGDPVRVGAFLFALFPKLRVLTDEFTDTRPRTWDPVMEVIENLQLQRGTADGESVHECIGTHVAHAETRLSALTT